MAVMSVYGLSWLYVYFLNVANFIATLRFLAFQPMVSSKIIFQRKIPRHTRTPVQRQECASLNKREKDRISRLRMNAWNLIFFFPSFPIVKPGRTLGDLRTMSKQQVLNNKTKER